MAKEIVTRKGRPIGKYGQFGGNLVQDASKFVCHVPQGTMVTVPDQDPNTERHMPF